MAKKGILGVIEGAAKEGGKVLTAAGKHDPLNSIEGLIGMKKQPGVKAPPASGEASGAAPGVQYPGMNQGAQQQFAEYQQRINQFNKLPKTVQDFLTARGEDPETWLKNQISQEQGTGSSSTQGQDPLTNQTFFMQAVAPYLNQISQQTQAYTAPLYAAAMKNAQGSPYAGVFNQFIPQLQAGEQQLQTALSGAAATAPAMDTLQQNIAAERAKAITDYYEQLAAKAAGGTATAGNPFGLSVPTTTGK